MLIKISLSEDETDHFKALEETGFYGRKGAGALIFCSKTNRYLLGLRSKGCEESGTWGIVGGAILPDEDPFEAVKREMTEELGVELHEKPKLLYIFKSGSFRYYNYLVTVNKEFMPRRNWETDKFEWFSRNVFPTPLHFGVQKLIDENKI